MRRAFLLLAGGIVVGTWASQSFAQAAPPSPAVTDEAVRKAIEKGVEHVWSLRRDDGSWAPYGSPGSHYYTVGPTALAAYALLESGVSPQDPRMAKTIEFLATHDDNMNYSVALRCQVWLLANRQTRNKYAKELEADVKRMMRSAYEGAYDYGADGNGHRHGFDNSNAQFGVLGVWAGARANLEFANEVWKNYWWSVSKHWLSCQCIDGGWGYTEAEPWAKNSMTAAGVATLFVCMDNSLGDAFLKCEVAQSGYQKAIDRGLEWLDRNFQENIRRPAPYYLYALERVGLASGMKYFGKADWYKAGAEYLLKQQARSAGAWSGGFGGDLQATCFSLLFLIRGRNPVLFNKLQFPGDWNNRPRALAGLTEWISRNFETTVNWQIIGLQVPVTEWHDAPIVYLSGSKAPTFTEEDLDKLRTYVQQGGTILSVTECKGAAFNKAMRETYAKLFPEYEMAAADKGHPLYTIHFPLRGRPRFQVLSNGVRPLAIHLEDDASLAWQMREKDTQPWAYEGAANAYFYITDKGVLRARGVNHWPAEPAAPPSKKVKVARVKYGGNWQPEPLAHERLSRLLAAEVGIGLDVSAVEAKDLASCGAAVACLTGTGTLNLSEAEKEALKKFVTGGGLLVADAAGGSRAFADSLDSLMQELFGQGAVKRLPADSPLHKAKEIPEATFRRVTRARLEKGAKDLRLKGVMVGSRLGVVLSREDITCGLVGCASYSCDGYLPETAYEIMRNVMLVAAGGAGVVPAGPPVAAPDSPPPLPAPVEDPNPPQPAQE